MKYDFTTLPDRHGRDAIAVDGLGKGFAPDAPRPGFDAIPMWVADMNFVCLPTIQQAVIERVQHPAFGYFDPTPSSSAPTTPRLATSTPPMNTSIPSSGGRQSATACRA